VLDPRWEPKEYFSKKLNRKVTSKADVEIVMGGDGPEVSSGGGVSLHNVQINRTTIVIKGKIIFFAAR
jgi:hypothetical protein